MAGARMSDDDRRRGVKGVQAARQALGRRASTASPAWRDGQQLAQVAACVLVRDEAHRVLLVEPAGRPGRWRLPGSWVGVDEYPLDTARRVARAHIGLEPARVGGALVGIDWVPAGEDRPATIVYVFDGGVLAASEAAKRIRLGADEVVAWQLADAKQWDELLSAATARRLQECVKAVATGAPVVLQHGWRRHR